MRTALSLKLYLIISGSIFFVVGLLHLLRLLSQVTVVVGGYAVPQLLSAVGFPVATAWGVWALALLRMTKDAG